MRRGSAVGSPVSAAAGPGSSLRARRAPWPSAPKATLRPPSAKSSARARGRSNLVTLGRAELPGEAEKNEGDLRISHGFSDRFSGHLHLQKISSHV